MADTNLTAAQLEEVEYRLDRAIQKWEKAPTERDAQLRRLQVDSTQNDPAVRVFHAVAIAMLALLADEDAYAQALDVAKARRAWTFGTL